MLVFSVQDGLGAQGSYAQMPFTIDVSLKCTAVTIRLASSNLFVIKELLELTKAPEASQRAKDTDTVEDDMAPQPVRTASPCLQLFCGSC